jgi:hypothetical protein
MGPFSRLFIELDEKPTTNFTQIFNSKSARMCAMHLICCEAKLTTLKLKTQPKQLLGCLPLDIVLLAKGIRAKHWKISSFCSMQTVYQNLTSMLQSLVHQALNI